jgi:hypothetical protein
MKHLFTFAKLLLGCMMLACSACSGMEVGGKLWVSRVDERQESQATHNVPLKCYLWSDCGKPVDNLK